MGWLRCCCWSLRGIVCVAVGCSQPARPAAAQSEDSKNSSETKGLRRSSSLREAPDCVRAGHFRAGPLAMRPAADRHSEGSGRPLTARSGSGDAWVQARLLLPATGSAYLRVWCWRPDQGAPWGRLPGGRARPGGRRPGGRLPGGRCLVVAAWCDQPNPSATIDQLLGAAACCLVGSFVEEPRS